ncbi:MAG: RdgB/HAM1 family non-canonical purine NTP pyrophosphatase [Clostridia bacterium]|nr:RdgB/HAM1 family non-canonical purine NTP pyrophosphatase [Clostridia bacterium]
MSEVFVIATNNQKKLREIDAILKQIGASAVAMAEAGISTDPEETGLSFEENAFIKANAACLASGKPAIADDSGLEVDALNKAPGIYSARYCEGTDSDRVNFLLRNMQGKSDRTARFVSAVCCVFPSGERITVRGECEGEIIDAPRGENGFGYDPVFYVPEYEQTFAEISPEIKNKISHRAHALEKLAIELKKREINHADK